MSNIKLFTLFGSFSELFQKGIIAPPREQFKEGYAQFRCSLYVISHVYGDHVPKTALKPLASVIPGLPGETVIPHPESEVGLCSL